MRSALWSAIKIALPRPNGTGNAHIDQMQTRFNCRVKGSVRDQRLKVCVVGSFVRNSFRRQARDVIQESGQPFRSATSRGNSITLKLRN